MRQVVFVSVRRCLNISLKRKFTTIIQLRRQSISTISGLFKFTVSVLVIESAAFVLIFILFIFLFLLLNHAAETNI